MPQQRQEVLQQLEKPANTENEYEQFYLENGMAVMLTTLPASEKSSAALYLGAGAQDDPLPGLAHFTEHAVFLGSHTYPVENAFKTFLSKNGGSSNGGTSMETTSYQFMVNHAAFSEALDIWSHFFVDPLFTDDAISREIMAVDAEDSKNRILDNRRMLQVLKDTLLDGDLGSPYKKFSTGNVKTLAKGDAVANGPELAAQMKTFYAQHYSPSKMTLSLVGPQPLDELRKLAIDKFAPVRGSEEHAIQQQKRTTYSGGVYPFADWAMQRTMRVKPVKDIRDMSLLIPLPPTRELHESPPTRLLASLLSNKAEGSLFALLQDKGWATAVSGGERTDYGDFCIFEVSVALTVEGLEHYTEVAEAVFRYLSAVESASDEELLRVWDEIATMGSLDFAFQEKATAYELAPFLARNMQELPLHKVLSSGWLLGKLDVALLRREFLSRLVPERTLTVLRSKAFSALPDDGVEAISKIGPGGQENEVLGTIRVEPWYQTPYALKPETPETRAAWAAARMAGMGDELHLPAPNPYVSPELAALVKPVQPHKLRSAPPVQIESGRVRAWHSVDEAFNQPRFVVHALVHSCGHSHLTRGGGHPVLSLAASVFQQTEARNFYFAGKAGLSYSFSVGSRGLGLSVSGYSPKLPVLLREVGERVGRPDYWREQIDEKTVEICKERTLRSLRSWVKERPDSVADVMLSYLLQEDARLPSERITLAEQMSKEALVGAMHDVLRRGRLTVYVHGDAARAGDAGFVSECAQSLSGLLGSEMPDEELESHQREHGWGLVDRVLRARRLPPNKRHVEVLLDSFNEEDANSALLVHLQTATRSPKASAMSLLLTSFLREPAFNELRTRRQLGYIVQTSAGGYGSQHLSMRGITFRVLSQRYGPREMLQAVDEFLAGQSAAFEALSQQDVDGRAASVIRSLEDPPTGYGEEAGAFWSAIIEDQPFDWVEQVIAELRAMSVGTIKEAFSKFVAENDERRSVAVMIESAAHKQARLASSTDATARTMTVEELKPLRDSLPFTA